MTRRLLPLLLLAACASPAAPQSPTSGPTSPPAVYGPAFVPSLPAASVLPAAVVAAASPSPISDTGDCFLVRWEVPDAPWLVEIECGPYRIAFNAAGDVWARREEP